MPGKVWEGKPVVPGKEHGALEQAAELAGKLTYEMGQRDAQHQGFVELAGEVAGICKVLAGKEKNKDMRELLAGYAERLEVARIVAQKDWEYALAVIKAITGVG